jgi:hypothetical protein
MGLVQQPTTAAAAIALSRRDAAGLPLLRRWPDFATKPFQRAFNDFASRHEIQGLVLVALERAGPIPGIPADVAANHRSTLQLLRRRAAMWDLERDLVLDRLARAGILPILLKGAALRLAAYGDPAERQFGDVDVLVPREDLQRAQDALTAAGYRPDHDRARFLLEHHHHLILRKESGFLVELHWHLEPPDSPFLLDPDRFRKDALPAPGRPGTLLPSAEHMVLHLATQNVEDGFSLLRRLVDIDRVIATAPAFSWDRLIGDAVGMRVNTPTALSLRLCSVLLGTGLPAAWLPALRVPRPVQAHLALFDPVDLLVGQRSRKRPAVGRLLTLWCIAGGAARLRALRDLQSGEPGWLAHQFAPPGGARTGRGWTLLGLLKTVLFQMAMYVTGGIAWATRPGRVQGFWGATSNGAPPAPETARPRAPPA